MRVVAVRASAAACLCLFCVASCSSSKGAAPPTGCGDGVAVADGCAGVPAAPICGGSTCTDGVACTSVTTVGSDSDLPGAIAAASAGSCIALQPGSYSDATLPAGVSLLGRSASDVHVDGVGIGGTAVVRGLEVGARGLRIADGAQDVRIDSVRAASSDRDGISIGKGAHATITASTVSDAGQGAHEGGNGIAAFGGGNVSIDHTLVRSAHGPGLWMQAACGDGCTCPGGATLSVHAIIIQGCEMVGAALAGVTATLGDVTIDGTAPYHVTLSQGGGIAISQCSAVTTDGSVTVSNGAYYGVLIDHSSATMGDDSGSTLTVTGNQVHGIWIQNVGKGGSSQSVTLKNLVSRGNAGVGIGLDGESQAIIIQGHSEVTDTVARALPALANGNTPTVQSLGDGLSWNAGVQARIDGLALRGNSRVDMLVTGQWAGGSSVSNLGVSDGDKNTIIIQGFTGGPMIPGMETVASNLVSKTPKLDMAVAQGPAAPVALSGK